MCGIVAYVGNSNSLPILLEGLQRLEYRGYDSVGIFVSNLEKNHMIKTVGKVANLRQEIQKQADCNGTIGMAHTRWATHGIPNKANAHPHHSNSKEIFLVHNGIIENYNTIKESLIQKGYFFYSDTDSEVLVNLIEEIQKQENVKLAKALQIALNQVIGAYGIVVFDKKNPDELIAACLGSPLAIGMGKNAFFVGSDASPFLEHTKDVVYLKDNEMAILKKRNFISIRSIVHDLCITPYIEKLQWNLESIQKGGHEHFMLKEIYEQPAAIQNVLRERLLVSKGRIQIESVDEYKNKFLQARRIIIIACGTSWHAGLVGEYLIENFAKIPVEVEYASEFRYRNPIIYSNDVVIPISQSGETADTIAALKIAQEQGAFVYGICNVVGSTISRETHSGMYTHAGPEIGVASTKAFTTQITALILIALKLSKIKEPIPHFEFRNYLLEFADIPRKMEDFIQNSSVIKKIANAYFESTNCLYLGRGYNFPVALEGALKLKEISYIHAEGYPAAEMKHGPMALIDENMPVVVIATKKGHYEKIVSNIQEIKARKGKIIAIVSAGDTVVTQLADHVIEIPESSECFTPLFSVLPLQLLSYYIAVMRGCNVDQPRNLAKAVTVE